MPETPSRSAALAFALKASALRARRGIRNLRSPVRPHERGATLPVLLAQVRAPLYEGREPEMELGKAQNLRLVARRLDGVRVPAGETLSFWRQVGRCRRGRGFVRGREIRQGCVVPSVGGGICGLTNGLYEAARGAGLDVIERHPHTRVIPGSVAERGMDAAVAWNYLDLRLRADFEWQVGVALTRDELVVTLRGEAPTSHRKLTSGMRPLDVVGDCATCGEGGCFRHPRRPRAMPGRTAYWVDEVGPEFAAYVAERAKGSLLFAPMRGRGLRLARNGRDRDVSDARPRLAGAPPRGPGRGATGGLPRAVRGARPSVRRSDAVRRGRDRSAHRPPALRVARERARRAAVPSARDAPTPRRDPPTAGRGVRAAPGAGLARRLPRAERTRGRRAGGAPGGGGDRDAAP